MAGVGCRSGASVKRAQQAAAFGERVLLRAIGESHEHRSETLVEQRLHPLADRRWVDVLHGRGRTVAELELDLAAAMQIDPTKTNPTVSSRGEDGVDESGVIEGAEQRVESVPHGATVVSVGTSSANDDTKVDQTSASS